MVLIAYNSVACWLAYRRSRRPICHLRCRGRNFIKRDPSPFRSARPLMHHPSQRMSWLSPDHLLRTLLHSSSPPTPSSSRPSAHPYLVYPLLLCPDIQMPQSASPFPSSRSRCPHPPHSHHCTCFYIRTPSLSCFPSSSQQFPQPSSRPSHPLKL